MTLETIDAQIRALRGHVGEVENIEKEEVDDHQIDSTQKKRMTKADEKCKYPHLILTYLQFRAHAKTRTRSRKLG